MNEIESLDWPTMSPDLNSIENLWEILERDVRKLPSSPKTIRQLEEALKTAWRNINPELCDRLVSSMEERIRGMIRAKGGHTKY